jgi:hypothetical protein
MTDAAVSRMVALLIPANAKSSIVSLSRALDYWSVAQAFQ